MSVNDELLQILCCPITKVPVKVLSFSEVLRINDQIAQGILMYANGSLVEFPIEEALITVDGKMIYKVEDSIPILLSEMGIPTHQLENSP